MKKRVEKKNVYVFPAVFSYADDGISVSFPDFPGCFSCGWTDVEALHMAKEALETHLRAMKDDGETIPEPTEMERVRVRRNERTVLVEIQMSRQEESKEGEIKH